MGMKINEVQYDHFAVRVAFIMGGAKFANRTVAIFTESR